MNPNLVIVGKWEHNSKLHLPGVRWAVSAQLSVLWVDKIFVVVSRNIWKTSQIFLWNISSLVAHFL